MGQLNISVKP